MLFSNMHWIEPGRSKRDEEITPRQTGTNRCVYTQAQTHRHTHFFPLTQGHDREVFAPELAGEGDLLSEGPAPFGDGMVGSCRWVVTHLGGGGWGVKRRGGCKSQSITR